MKYLKYGILFLTFIIVIISIILYMTKQRIYRNAEEYDKQPHIDEIETIQTELVKEESTYFYVKDCLEKVISYATRNDNIAVYNTINKEYIEKNNITQDNVLEITKLNNISNYRIKEMYGLDGFGHHNYYVNEILDNNDIYININLDWTNNTFDFSILNKEEFDKYISTTIEANIEETGKSIEKNANNIIINKILSKSDIAEKYLLDYIEKSVESPEEAYELLDKQYKNAKFESLDDFKNYVKNKTALQEFYKKIHSTIEDYEDINEYVMMQSNIKMQRYDVNKKDGYTQYICVDSLGNYYIFNATSAMKYSAILDTYTVDISEFIEKYNSSNTQEKVVLNLNKFMMAINDKDYKYAYSILADSFKKANFPTLESFETYAKQNFFDINEFEYEKYGSEGDTYYTYAVTIKDASGADTNTKSRTFIMQLNEGTNFVLSFNK